jgi:hypothetical protein
MYTYSKQMSSVTPMTKHIYNLSLVKIVKIIEHNHATTLKVGPMIIFLPKCVFIYSNLGALCTIPDKLDNYQ